MNDDLCSAASRGAAPLLGRPRPGSLLSACTSAPAPAEPAQPATATQRLATRSRAAEQAGQQTPSQRLPPNPLPNQRSPRKQHPGWGLGQITITPPRLAWARSLHRLTRTRSRT